MLLEWPTGERLLATGRLSPEPLTAPEPATQLVSVPVLPSFSPDALAAFSPVLPPSVPSHSTYLQASPCPAHMARPGSTVGELCKSHGDPSLLRPRNVGTPCTDGAWVWYPVLHWWSPF